VGILLGLERSRLARSTRGWHQLLELGALFRTLRADQDGVYDPTDSKDRLLPGLQGTMSAAERPLRRRRMYQGLLHKARRGEACNHAPLGYVQLPTGAFALDPDEQVPAAVRRIFGAFDRQGTVPGRLRYLVRHGLRIPVRPHSGPSRGAPRWRRPDRVTWHHLLRHPI
jgi:DNA invertase Pin-like site-specific DNA recombinase